MIPRLLALLSCLALGSCSAIKASYNHLDWLVDWQVSRYVEFAPEQRVVFEDAFQEFWDWHRGTQLTLYAADLREIAARADAPFSREQVGNYYERATDHANRAMRAALPESARVLATLDDEQVRELLDRLAKKREDTRQKNLDLGIKGLQKQSERNMSKNVKRWIGSLSNEQEARIRDWAHDRRYAGDQWVRYQESWAERFAGALAERRQPGFEQKLAELLQDVRVPEKEPLGRLQAANRRAWIALISDLSQTLSATQRGRLRESLTGFAADLDTLAAQPKSG